MRRGSIWWASLPAPVGAMPGFRRPLVIVSANSFNRSRIDTVLAVALTSDVRLAEAPGNVRLAARETGLPKDAVVNVAQVITVERSLLTEKVAELDVRQMRRIEYGLRLALSL